MKIKSTGLGKTELTGYIEAIKRVDDHLVVTMRTEQPVRWHVRVAVAPNDLRQMIKVGLKGPTLKYVISKLFNKSEPSPITDY